MATRWVCNTPQHHCWGTITLVSEWQGGNINTRRTHASSQAAYQCYRHYLISVLGYRPCGPNEFARDEGPVLTLSRPGRYGARLRKGKTGRWMPADRNGGIIIG